MWRAIACCGAGRLLAAEITSLSLGGVGATDGRGLVSADGSEPAKVTVVGDGLIEVAVAGDRYRLPANTGGAK